MTFQTGVLFLRYPVNSKSIFGVHELRGLSHLTQLRVGLSKLNFHKFKPGFRDAVNPMCPTNDGITDTEHFLLRPSFDIQKRDLLTGVLALGRLTNPSKRGLNATFNV